MQSEQLYNLENDPGELHNVAGSNPQVISRCKSEIEKIKNRQ